MARFRIIKEATWKQAVAFLFTMPVYLFRAVPIDRPPRQELVVDNWAASEPYR